MLPRNNNLNQGFESLPAGHGDLCREKGLLRRLRLLAMTPLLHFSDDPLLYLTTSNL
jgi:hypothetical protein